MAGRLQFNAERPDQLWVADFTYVSTWQGQMFVAFVIDVYARRIVGWRVSSHMRTDFVVDALEQALCARQPAPQDVCLIHHTDRGSQYISLRYTERLAESGLTPDVAPSRSALQPYGFKNRCPHKSRFTSESICLGNQNQHSLSIHNNMLSTLCRLLKVSWVRRKFTCGK